MRKVARYGIYALGIVALLAVVGYGTAFTMSERKLGETYEVSLRGVAIPTNAEAIAWGSHLVNAVTGCQDCHGPGLSGSVIADDAAALVAAPNLTAGRGGIGAGFSDADWIRAIRHGVRRDGRSLLIMPSYAYAHLSDHDLGAMVAYLKQIPPVDNELPDFRLRPLGRALVAAGVFDEEIVAKKMPATTGGDAIAPGLTLEYGRYLATVGGCTSCHRPDLKGGPMGAPGAPPAADISPTALAGWHDDDFLRAMREGRRPDGSEIDPVMPWRAMGQMSDAELLAIWLFLQDAD
jgi:cytochrome c553